MHVSYLSKLIRTFLAAFSPLKYFKSRNAIAVLQPQLQCGILDMAAMRHSLHTMGE